MIRVALLGDIAFIGRCDLSKNDNAKDYFSEVAEILSEFDLVIGNLETPFVTNQKPYKAKSAHIGSDPINVELLKYLNIDIVTLANNHIYDFGYDSLELTEDVLTKNEIEYCGINNKVVYKEFDNNKLSVSGFCCYSTNALGLDKGIDVLNIEALQKLLSNDKDNEVLSIVNAHFGQEHVHVPNIDHIHMARMLTSDNDYILAGSHPHVLQGMEMHKKSLLAYSLGNFCFDDVYLNDNRTKVYELNEWNRMTTILSVTMSKNQIVDYTNIPVHITKSKLSLANTAILDHLLEYSDALNFSDENKYMLERQQEISKYIAKRKSARDLKWILSRLNFGSVSRILNIRNNKAKYELNITNYLRDEVND